MRFFILLVWPPYIYSRDALVASSTFTFTFILAGLLFSIYVRGFLFPRNFSIFWAYAWES
jgi:hypothetical protein